MSDRMTSIRINGVFGAGLGENGRKTPAEMIALIRKYAEHQKQLADTILATPDADFHVATYVGPYAMKQYEVLQEGKAKSEGRQP